MPKDGAKMTRPIRVLFNTYPVAFHCPGGGEVQLLKYKEELEKVGIEVLLFDQWHPQFREADIVHHFTVQPGSHRFCHFVKKLGLPLVLSPIVWVEEGKSYPLGEIQKLLNLADSILPNSMRESERLSQQFQVPLSRFTPVVNGVDSIFFEHVSPSIFRKRFALNEPFVLCMGNIEARKNQLTLVRALKETGIRLVFAGQVREPAYGEQCKSEGGSQVLWVGNLKHGSEIQRSAYAACDVFVLPSTLETPGLAALEAGACNARLVLTDEGCTEEYFGENALYVNHRSVASIRDAVLKSKQTSRPAGLSQHIQKKYTWARAAEELKEVYSRFLS